VTETGGAPVVQPARAASGPAARARARRARMASLVEVSLMGGAAASSLSWACARWQRNSNVLAAARLLYN
jgi:hypothetical protein